MSGQFTLDASSPPLAQWAAPIAVCRFDPSQTGDSRCVLLPNIVCERIEYPIGAQASTASFRYLLDTTGLFPDWPNQFDQIWPQGTASGPYVVGTDDRIAVLSWDGNGNQMLIWEGFAAIPQVNLDGGSQRVTFTGTGSECRAWDTPISGRMQRQGSHPDANTTANQLLIDLPCRFNPSSGHPADTDGGVLPNCTPDTYDTDAGGSGDVSMMYPVFLDEHITEMTPDPRTYWTVSKAICYILATYNHTEDYVANPDFSWIRANLLLKVPSASNGDGVIDPTDPSTYTTVDVPLRDYDAANKLWPDVLADLLRQIGFGFFFSVPQDTQPNEYGRAPQRELRFFRFDQSVTAPLNFLLADWGSTVVDTVSDVGGAALVRDLNQVVNAFSTETPPERWETSIVLAPGFQPAAGDETAANRQQFLKSRLADATAAVMRKYRWYVADECGEGHWDHDTMAWVTTPLDLTPLFPDDDNGNQTYVERHRPGSHTLITLDAEGRPRRAILHVSFDYTGAIPGVWDGTGTWFALPGGWKLLDDRLGIECTAEDPEQWFAGKGKADLKGITWQANPTASGSLPSTWNGLNIPTLTPFVLMLTTVLDDDIMIPAVVPKRIASPTKFERRRRIDARDHYQLLTVFYPSQYNNDSTPDATKKDVVVRDDTKKALALARQYRAAHEMPPLSGSVTVPCFTTYYSRGELVGQIDGRNVSLHTNTAGDKGEGPRYPFVTKISWSFAGDRQSTTIQLSDLRAEPRA